MKLQVDKYVYEAPGISIVPETEYEAAVLHRYWASAKLSIGKGENGSANGYAYSIKFVEPPEGK